MHKKIAIIGAGAWGSAIALLLTDNGFDVTLWAYEAEVVHDIETFHNNKKYFPGVVLPDRIKATNNLKEALEHTEWIFEATPVQYLRAVLRQVKEQVPSAAFAKWVLLSKGIEQNTNYLPSQILEEVLQSPPYAVLGGPTFAVEVAAKAFTSASIASHSEQLVKDVSEMLANNYFKPFTSTDPIGVQIGGAVKNVIALAVGIAEGAGYGYNARAYLMTQGLHEITMLAEFFGGKKETVLGPSGLGDLILTCTGDLSKNLRLGRKIGQGMTIQRLLEEYSILPEGMNTVQSLHEMIANKHLVLSLCRGTYDCIFQGETFAKVLQDLQG